MSEEPPSVTCAGCVFLSAENYVRPDRVGARADRVHRFCGPPVSMNLHVTEIVTEPTLEELKIIRAKRLPWSAQDIVDNGGRFGKGSRL